MVTGPSRHLEPQGVDVSTPQPPDKKGPSCGLVTMIVVGVLAVLYFVGYAVVACSGRFCGLPIPGG